MKEENAVLISQYIYMFSYFFEKIKQAITMQNLSLLNEIAEICNEQKYGMHMKNISITETYF